MKEAPLFRHKDIFMQERHYIHARKALHSCKKDITFMQERHYIHARKTLHSCKKGITFMQERHYI
ncbi:hypothetical protein, partial [Xylanibacter rodentium]|uniref:hypothetical protein n=1 Tax=Xylanibacter rodentium TaxID=2736289 RepID=UPI002557F9BE